MRKRIHSQGTKNFKVSTQDKLLEAVFSSGANPKRKLKAINSVNSLLRRTNDATSPEKLTKEKIRM